MHNGFVRVDNEKMSKSLGNFFTIRDVLKTYDAETVRFFILRAHYRSALNYSDAHLNDARSALKRLYTALASVEAEAIALDWDANDYARNFAAAMNDDFATPAAVAVLFDLAAEVNRTGSTHLAGWLRALGGVLGLLQTDPQVYLQGDAADLDAERIASLIQQRQMAKANKDFASADAIRKQLLEEGIVLKDSPTGTTWERA